MPPDIPEIDDPVTPWIFKWIVLPIMAAIFLMMILEVQIGEWKCDREAKRQGYLEGNYFPAYKFTPASCVCRKKVLPDGTVDENAKMVIDLENKELCW
jgi:hypothetical protein